jgi:2-C-methyl-D-erythritol 4-phosphate cytidylyltransferase
MLKDQVDVVVLAAGQGERMQASTNKLFLTLQNIPIILHTLIRLEAIPAVNKIYLVLKAGEQEKMEQVFLTHGRVSKLTKIVQGGQNRDDSVRNGLQAVLEAERDGWVMVHDGARPLITDKLVSRLLANATKMGIVVPALPIFETIRKMTMEGKTKQIDRQELYTIQTPQLFHKSAIERVYLKGYQKVPDPTDEASFFEYCGEPVKLIDGEKWNLKITRPDDLKWAETLLETMA